MKIYLDPAADWQVERKADNSPLTIADRRAHTIIADALAATHVPLLSEEGIHTPFEERKQWDRLWIVDPLDGTKEFLKRNGEFTVNIALVENGMPIAGVIYVPATRVLYWGYCYREGATLYQSARRCDVAADGSRENEQSLPLAPEPRPYTVVASRSHLSEATEEFIASERELHPDLVLKSAGSSLKICLVAEGRADVYPRLAPTMEWDTAAGHAIALGAGCDIVNADDLSPVVYNKPDLLNPFFIVRR